MEPVFGSLVVAGVAGLTRALSTKAEQIVEVVEGRLHSNDPPEQARVVLIVEPKHNAQAVDGMKLGR